MQLDPSILYQIPVLLLALSFHEMSHAWAADRLGDPTGRLLGRLTMDPRPHIDPIGTLLFPALLLFIGLPAFGWAKPVPFTPRNLRNPGLYSALIYAAGPLSNLLLAISGAIVFRVLLAAQPGADSFLEAALTVLAFFVGMNLLLVFFNFIPIPPLDGGGVLMSLAPPSMAPVVDFLRQYGPFLFILLIVTGWFQFFILPAAIVRSLLLGGG